MVKDLDIGHGGHTTQLAPEQRRSEASILLQLARWTAETGQGAKADIKGVSLTSSSFRCMMFTGLLCGLDKLCSYRLTSAEPKHCTSSCHFACKMQCSG